MPHIPHRRNNPFANPRDPREIEGSITLLGSRRVNFFAVGDGRQVTLVDCGFKGHWRYLRAWLDSTGRTIADIEAIVLTHGHADHVGFAPYLAELGVPVHLHRADRDHACFTGIKRPPQRLITRLHRRDARSLFAEAIADGVFRQPALVDPHTFVDGDVIDAPGHLRVVQVPGHNPGSCSLFHAETGSMFTGDALMTLDPMFSTTGALTFAERDSDDHHALAGLTALGPYRDARLLPAHGEPWTHRGAVGEAIDTARISTPARPFSRPRSGR